MVATLRLLFVLACVATLISVASAESCTTADWGNTSGVKIDLPPVVLTKGIADWIITINPPEGCHLNGVVGKACDDDVAPDASFASAYKLIVHRNGNLENDGVVTASVYCIENAPAPIATPFKDTF